MNGNLKSEHKQVQCSMRITVEKQQPILCSPFWHFKIGFFIKYFIDTNRIKIILDILKKIHTQSNSNSMNRDFGACASLFCKILKRMWMYGCLLLFHAAFLLFCLCIVILNSTLFSWTLATDKGANRVALKQLSRIDCELHLKRKIFIRQKSCCVSIPLNSP